jgi:hypothetical protein
LVVYVRFLAVILYEVLLSTTVAAFLAVANPVVV